MTVDMQPAPDGRQNEAESYVSDSPKDRETLVIKLSKIVVEEQRNPRKTLASKASDEALVASIKRHGLFSALIVVKLAPDPVRSPLLKYRLVAGYRRFRALQALSEYQCVCFVAGLEGEVDEIEIATEENERRVNMTAWDKADLCRLYYSRGLPPENIRKLISDNGTPISLSRVYDYLRVTTLGTEVQSRLRRHPSGITIGLHLTQLEFRFSKASEASTFKLGPLDWDERKQLKRLDEMFSEIAPSHGVKVIGGLRWKVKPEIALAVAQKRGGSMLAFCKYLLGQAPLSDVEQMPGETDLETLLHIRLPTETRKLMTQQATNGGYPAAPGPAQPGYVWHHHINADGSRGWMQVPMEQSPMTQAADQAGAAPEAGTPLGAETFVHSQGGFVPVVPNSGTMADLAAQLESGMRPQHGGGVQQNSHASGIPLRRPGDLANQPQAALTGAGVAQKGEAKPIPLREPGDAMSQNPLFRGHLDAHARPLPPPTSQPQPQQQSAPLHVPVAPPQLASPPGVTWMVHPADALDMMFAIDAAERKLPENDALPRGLIVGVVRYFLGVGPYPFAQKVETPKEEPKPAEVIATPAPTVAAPAATGEKFRALMKHAKRILRMRGDDAEAFYELLPADDRDAVKDLVAEMHEAAASAEKDAI